MDATTDLRKRVCAANLDLPRHGLVVHTFGNVSGIDRERGLMAIKPSGVPYERLTPDSMVLVDIEDYSVIGGGLNPSSDTRTHAVLYRNFPHIEGIVHTHSTYATAWAQAMRPIPCLGTTHADHVPGDIPCTAVISDEQISRDYEEETGSQILESFRDLSPDIVQMVLVACHGPFTWGESPEKAVYNSVVLEELARMALLTLSIAPDTPPLRDTLLQKHFRRKHGPDATYGQNGSAPPPAQDNEAGRYWRAMTRHVRRSRSHPGERAMPGLTERHT